MRKEVDFNNWVLVVKRHKLGYYALSEEKIFILKIIVNYYKFRYFSNSIINSILAQAVINLFFLDLLFDVSSGFSHTLLAHKYY